MGQVHCHSRQGSSHIILLLSGVVLLAVFAGYAIIPEHCPWGDNMGYFLGAASLALEGNLDLDEYASRMPDYAVHRYQGRLYSSYPIAPALLLYPFTKLAFALNLTEVPDRIADLAAALWVAIACSILLIVLSRIVPLRWAFILALGLAFGSPVFSNCTSEFWSHVPAMVFLCLSIYLVQQPASNAVALGIGISSGCAFFCRSQILVGIGLLVLCWLSYNRLRRWAPFAVGLGSVAATILTLRHATSGHILGSYTVEQLDVSVGHTFGDPALWSYLFSPSRGMLVYFPVAVLALYEILSRAGCIFPFLFRTIINVWQRVRGKSGLDGQPSVNDLAQVSAIAVTAELLIYSSWSIWTGGWCFGSRFAIDSAPWVLVLCGTWFQRHSQSKWPKLLIVGLLVLGFGVNLPGAFNYALIGWCAETDVADRWSFQRSQLYCAWREMLGLENEQLLVHLKAKLWFDHNNEPWAKIFYWNPTQNKTATFLAGVSARQSPSSEYKLSKIYELGSYNLERGISGSSKLPLQSWFDDCRYREIRIDFILIQGHLKKASNLTTIQFARPAP